jgi:ubiquinone/menaquinone biosynthesis C-methylase UbiE
MAEEKSSKPQLDWDKAKKFLFQVNGDIGAAMLGALNYIGDRLGIFKALADAGWVTSQELADRAGLKERYVREWLGAVTSAGYVSYDPATKKYLLPPEHAMVLAREESPFFMGGFLEMIVPNISVAPKLVEKFRNGGGVTQAEYPLELWEAMERSSAGMYRNQLVRKWLPTMPQVIDALSAGGSAADIGCGSGRAAIAIATAFPKAKVFGFDVHPGSIERARANAQAAGVGDRISFEARDAGKLPENQFDFISTFDVVHDSVNPIALLKSIRAAMKKDATYLMLEVNASGNLEDNLGPTGKMMYSVSTLYCMTTSLAHGGAGIGACMGEPKARELVAEAGFAQFRRLPIEDMFNALYEIRS